MKKPEQLAFGIDPKHDLIRRVQDLAKTRTNGSIVFPAGKYAVCYQIELGWFHLPEKVALYKGQSEVAFRRDSGGWIIERARRGKKTLKGRQLEAFIERALTEVTRMNSPFDDIH